MKKSELKQIIKETATDFIKERSVPDNMRDKLDSQWMTMADQDKINLLLKYVKDPARVDSLVNRDLVQIPNEVVAAITRDPDFGKTAKTPDVSLVSNNNPSQVDEITVIDDTPSGKNIYSFLRKVDDTSLSPQQRVDILVAAVNKWNETFRSTKAGKYKPKIIVTNYLTQSYSNPIQEGEIEQNNSEPSSQELIQALSQFGDPKAIMGDIKNASEKGEQIKGKVNEITGEEGLLIVLGTLMAPHVGQAVASMMEYLKRQIGVLRGDITYKDIDNMQNRNLGLNKKDDKEDILGPGNKPVHGGGHKPHEREFFSPFAKWINNKSKKFHEKLLLPITAILKMIAFFKKDSHLKDPHIREKIADGIYIAFFMIVIIKSFSEHGVHGAEGTLESIKLGDLGADSLALVSSMMVAAIGSVKSLSPVDQHWIIKIMSRVLKAIPGYV